MARIFTMIHTANTSPFCLSTSLRNCFDFIFRRVKIYFGLPGQIATGQPVKMYEFSKSAPPTVISDKNVMTVFYLTGLEINTVGFHADYTTVGNEIIPC